MRLVVSREPVVADAVKVAQAGAEAARKVLRLHPVHHVHAGLPVLGGGDQDQVLPQRVLRVAHQHALIARLRKGSTELPFRHEDGVTLHAGHLHPVPFQVTAGERGATHQVMGLKTVVLLEGDLPVSVFQYGGLYLPVGGTDAQHSAHAAYLLDKQFQHHHDLAHRQLVNGQVRKFFLHPEPPPLTEKTVYEFRTAKQSLHDERQQLGVALVINTRIILLPDTDAFLEGDFLLRTVGPLLADELGLAPPSREKVVVGGKCIVPAPDNVRKVRAGHGGLRIAAHLVDAVRQAFHHARGKRVADLKVHLRGKRHLTRDFSDTAAAETRFREILLTFQPHAAAGVKVYSTSLDIHVVRRALVHGDVDGVLRIVRVDGRQVFLLGKRVVLVGHADVPEDIFVTGFRYEVPAGKLHVVVIRPNGDDLELPGVAVVIHLEIVGAVLLLAKAGQFAAFLERDAFHLSAKLVVVGVEVQRVVPEIVYREGGPVLARRLLAAHRGDCTDAPGVDIREGVLLVVVVDAVLLHIHVHVFRAAGKLQPAVPVFIRVDVTGTADREQAGVELRAVGLVAGEFRQPLPVGQGDLLTVFTAAEVHRLAFHPPLGTRHLAGEFLQRVGAVLPLVVDHHVLRALHAAHLPVGHAAHAVIDRLHDQRHVLTRRGRQREHRLRVAVHHVQDEEPLHQALDPVELHVVLPLLHAAFLRKIPLLKPVALTFEVHVVVHFQCHIFIQGEGERQHVVRLDLLHLCRAVVRGKDRLRLPVTVIYR